MNVSDVKELIEVAKQQTLEFINVRNCIQKLIDENEQLKEKLQELRESSNNQYNERGAGRKSKFIYVEKKAIKELRQQNKTIKEIAESFNCSVGLIHKIINEK